MFYLLLLIYVFPTLFAFHFSPSGSATREPIRLVWCLSRASTRVRTSGSRSLSLCSPSVGMASLRPYRSSILPVLSGCSIRITRCGLDQFRFLIDWLWLCVRQLVLILPGCFCLVMCLFKSPFVPLGYLNQCLQGVISSSLSF